MSNEILRIGDMRMKKKASSLRRSSHLTEEKIEQSSTASNNHSNAISSFISETREDWQERAL